MIAATAASLGDWSREAFGRWPGLLVPAFVVPVGLILPLIVSRGSGRRGVATSAALALVGGFVLRAAIVGMPIPSLLATHR